MIVIKLIFLRDVLLIVSHVVRSVSLIVVLLAKNAVVLKYSVNSLE